MKWLAIVLVSRVAYADRDWAVGVELGSFGAPAGHLGIPLASEHVAPAVYARRALDDRFSLVGSFGLATAAGLQLALGGEYRYALTPYLDAFASLSLQGGFAGPDYYARRDNVFVGYAYAAEGTFALGLRATAGLRLHVGRFELGLGPSDAVARPIAPHGDATFDNLFSMELLLGLRF